MRQVLKFALSVAVLALAAVLIRHFLEHDEREVQGPRSTEKPLTRDELYREAARLDIAGRSKMNKRQLQKAVEDATSAGPA